MVGPGQQSSQQIVFGREVEVHRRPGKARLPRDLVHRDLGEGGTRQHPLGDIEDLRFANLTLGGSGRPLTLAAP